MRTSALISFGMLPASLLIKNPITVYLFGLREFAHLDTNCFQSKLVTKDEKRLVQTSVWECDLERRTLGRLTCVITECYKNPTECFPKLMRTHNLDPAILGPCI